MGLPFLIFRMNILDYIFKSTTVHENLLTLE